MPKFRYKELYRAVATSPAGQKRINTVMRNKFAAAQEEMLRDFDEHEVTREIQDGVGATNISQTLGGYGDLYSFIGFPEGRSPTDEVRDVLESETQMIATQKPDVRGDKIRVKFSLRIPIQKIRDVARMPWESGNSWVDGIEKGISGFSKFLAGYFAKSISGGGIQAKHDVFEEEFQPVDYLTGIFKRFVARFR